MMVLFRKSELAKHIAEKDKKQRKTKQHYQNVSENEFEGRCNDAIIALEKMLDEYQVNLHPYGFDGKLIFTDVQRQNSRGFNVVFYLMHDGRIEDGHVCAITLARKRLGQLQICDNYEEVFSLKVTLLLDLAYLQVEKKHKIKFFTKENDWEKRQIIFDGNNHPRPQEI